jgi:hypothetical protein
LQETQKDQNSKGNVRQMGEIITTIFVLFIGAAVGVGGLVLLIYLFSD